MPGNNDTIGLDENYSDITLNEIIEKKKGFFENVLLSDIKYYNGAPKDTLIVHFQSLDFCGNSPIKRIDPGLLYPLVESKALKYGFKKLVVDTADMLLRQERKKMAFYILNISAYKNKAHVDQLYFFEVDSLHKINISSNTAISL
jgi:hypothetical protein